MQDYENAMINCFVAVVLRASCVQVIVALAGMWYFKEEPSFMNMCSIGAGLAAGFLFVFAKQGTTKQGTTKEQSEPVSDGKGHGGDAEMGNGGLWKADSPRQHPLAPVAGSQAFLLNESLHKSS